MYIIVILMLFVTTQMARFTVSVITVIQGMESTVQVRRP